MRCARLFQKYPAQALLSSPLPGLPLNSLILKLFSPHPRLEIEPLDFIRRGSNYPAPSFPLYSFRSNLYLKVEFELVTSERDRSGFWAQGTFRIKQSGEKGQILYQKEFQKVKFNMGAVCDKSLELV